uniref:Uncharacterized protein n=1 Tax=Coprothermobacter proteolyticus (strain ATCC 35245 / DSM 5265 / OCM 4 / BT) TaxID=309798 RepID=B5Y643_COPPD
MIKDEREVRKHGKEEREEGTWSTGDIVPCGRFGRGLYRRYKA